jgi:hypothetical protein
MPECQTVVFREGNLEEALLRAANQPTKLTAFFNFYQIDQRARQYLYTEIPIFYVWRQDTHMWRERQR